MKNKGKFSISPRDKKSTKKSLDELKEAGQDQIDGEDVQGGWVQIAGVSRQSDDDPEKPKL